METIKAEKPETGTPRDAGQHTPGPWDQNGALIWSTGTKPRTTIAETDVFLDQEESRANARLIAAAPELLAALRESVAAYEKFRAGRETGHLWPDPNHILHAKAAIAKATAP